MKNILTSPSPHSSSFSSSRRQFRRIITKPDPAATDPDPARRPGPVSLLRAALSLIRLSRRPGPRSRVVGTLYGARRGHVQLAFQASPTAAPLFLIELAMPTAALVREMACGQARIALECERGGGEGAWRAYCNGRKCGYGARRECGGADWRVLRAVEVVSMGAGVLPPAKGVAVSGEGEAEGEMMYMRARFERVAVGSGDSEAFYMISPDGNVGLELTVFLLRV